MENIIQISNINENNRYHLKEITQSQVLTKNKLTKILRNVNKLNRKLGSLIIIKKKGKMCSVNGNSYEKKIHDVIKNTMFNGSRFTTQKDTDLAGSTCDNDLECMLYNKIIGIEAKIYNTPDWMQCSLKYSNGSWHGSKNGKIPEIARNIFDKLLKNIVLFNGKIPPFINKKYTHKQWISIKNKTNDWDDCYINIPNDTIKNIYIAKGCYYIQISEYGLYHLGNDIYKFNVPVFIIDQEIRIRTKIHTRKDKNGFCSLSVTAACKPKNIKHLIKSQYSLDNIGELPKSLIVI
jgi:alkyl hydroperoxide reductase subunit AhpC